MSFTGHHLLLLAAFILPFWTLVQGRRSHSYHESWTSSNQKGFENSGRGKSPDKWRGRSTNSSNRLAEIVPNMMVPIDHFRKPFDQFHFPWKNYEEWKRHQKKIEDEIDRMLKPRNRRFPPNPRSKKFGSREKLSEPQFPTSGKTQKKHKKKKLGGKHKKSPKLRHEPPLSMKMPTSTETATRTSNSTPFPHEDFPSGGVVLAVKYYSTNDQ